MFLIEYCAFLDDNEMKVINTTLSAGVWMYSLLSQQISQQ